MAWSAILARNGYSAMQTESGGAGAHSRGDGLSATAFPAGLRNMPVEIAEETLPLLFRRRELRCDSGGPGQYRGGLGLSVELTPQGQDGLQLLASFGHSQRTPA